MTAVVLLCKPFVTFLLQSYFLSNIVFLNIALELDMKQDLERIILSMRS